MRIFLSILKMRIASDLRMLPNVVGDCMVSSSNLSSHGRGKPTEEQPSSEILSEILRGTLKI